MQYGKGEYLRLTVPRPAIRTLQRLQDTAQERVFADGIAAIRSIHIGLGYPKERIPQKN